MLGEERGLADTGRRDIRPWAWWLAAAAVPLIALVAALWVGGAVRQPVPFGLPDAGPVTKWGLPVARLVSDIAAMVLLGGLLAAAWLLPSDNGWLRPVGRRCVRLAGVAASLWTLAAILTLLLSISDATGFPLTRLSAESVRSYAGTVSQGRALVFVIVIAGVIAVLAWRTTRANSAGLLLIYAYVGLLPPVFTGHAATASSHNLAVTTTAVHVVAVGTWVGGLLALVLVGRAAPDHLAHAVPRFSDLALYGWLVTAVSGILSAGVRLNWSLDRLTQSGYGGLLVVKVAALVALGALGWLHRSRSGAALAVASGQRRFLRLAGVEALVMLATVGIAVALARTPPV